MGTVYEMPGQVFLHSSSMSTPLHGTNKNGCLSCGTNGSSIFFYMTDMAYVFCACMGSFKHDTNTKISKWIHYIELISSSCIAAQ